jgi:hypothetical protein
VDCCAPLPISRDKQRFFAAFWKKRHHVLLENSEIGNIAAVKRAIGLGLL